MQGTGDLAGFSRVPDLAIATEMHTGPRNPGDPVQSFDTEMVRLQGEIFGDPDFDTLRVQAGTDFGLPSPGQTTLSRLPDGDYAVDSFFDITYRIEFQGAPGSALDGFAGTTESTVPMTPGEVVDPNPDRGDDRWKTLDGGYNFSDNPIPPDFFDPGSLPFDGPVELEGNPQAGDGMDTIIRRLDKAELPAVGDTDTIPIEIVELRLVSTQPIQVEFSSGPPELWDVEVQLDPLAPPGPGSMTIERGLVDPGGTFDSFLPIQPLFTFTKVGDPSEVRVLDAEGGLPPSTLNSLMSVPWVYVLPDYTVLLPEARGNRFFPAGPLELTSPEFQLFLGPAHVPEPGTCALLGLGLLGALRRRRRFGTQPRQSPPRTAAARTR